MPGPFLGAVALICIGAMIVACAEPTPTPASPEARPAVSTVGPQRAVATAPADSPAPAETGVEAAVQIVERAFTGQEAKDIASLLRNARSAGDDEQQFQAYLGAWQLMRLAYHQQGQTADRKAAMDAVEQIASRYSRYQKDLFQLNK
ncbi:MAG: hypothetical protein HY331_11240 [Chloroflexi bacterium]|nr:hypothetical protein [Chloroflexota bacterium]